MRDPAGHSRNGEQDWEHVSGEAHGLVDDSGVEIDVGVQLSLDEVFILEGDLFKFDGDFDHIFLSYNFKDIICDLLDNLGSRIIILINPMPESHQLLLPIL